MMATAPLSADILLRLDGTAEPEPSTAGDKQGAESTVPEHRDFGADQAERPACASASGGTLPLARLPAQASQAEGSGAGERLPWGLRGAARRPKLGQRPNAGSWPSDRP
jgi:hypothetical protein